jgi:hypothetical protein
VNIGKDRAMRVGDVDMSDLVNSASRDQRYINAARNLERVRCFMQSHLGCSPKEAAYALDLSGDQARRAVRKIREEWKSRGREQ